MAVSYIVIVLKEAFWNKSKELPTQLKDSLDRLVAHYLKSKWVSTRVSFHIRSRTWQINRINKINTAVIGLIMD